MLSFSRLQNIAQKAVDVNEIINSARDLIQVTMAADVHVEFTPAPDPWPCNVDTAQLEQALLNLAINANDAMKEGPQIRPVRPVRPAALLSPRPTSPCPMTPTMIPMTGRVCRRETMWP
jgi:C4-dicarboxylate-specific signal transduction histidine kinase